MFGQCTAGLARLLAALLLATGAAGVQAASIVVPNANATAEGNSSDVVSAGSQRYMQLYDASQFAALGGPVLITGAVLRPDASQTGPGSQTFADIMIFLSTTSRSAATLSPTFAANLGPDNALVFSGPLTISTADLPGPGGTKQFDIVFPFTTPFLYDPRAGNLLSDSQITNASTSGIVLDFVSNNPVAGAVAALGSSTAATGTVMPIGAVTEYLVQPVPEPSTLVLAGLGALVLLASVRRPSPG